MTLRIFSYFFLYWFIFIPMSMAFWVGLRENNLDSYLYIFFFYAVLYSVMTACFFITSITLFCLIEALPISRKCMFTHLCEPLLFLITFGFALNTEGFIILLYTSCTYLVLVFILRKQSDLIRNI